MRIAPLLLAATLAACSRGVPPSGAVVVRGHVVDDETGKPVPRTTIYVHAFDDAKKRQVTAAPKADDSFELTAPAPTIRLRVADTSDRYLLNEQTFAATSATVDMTIRLVPSHWVRLYGRVLWRDGDWLRPTSQGGADVASAFLGIGPKSGVRPNVDGSYSVRVPREVVSILPVNTSRAPQPKSVDLRDVKGDEKQLDIILE